MPVPPRIKQHKFDIRYNIAPTLKTHVVCVNWYDKEYPYINSFPYTYPVFKQQEMISSLAPFLLLKTCLAITHNPNQYESFFHAGINYFGCYTKSLLIDYDREIYGINLDEPANVKRLNGEGKLLHFIGKASLNVSTFLCQKEIYPGWAALHRLKDKLLYLSVVAPEKTCFVPIYVREED